MLKEGIKTIATVITLAVMVPAMPAIADVHLIEFQSHDLSVSLNAESHSVKIRDVAVAKMQEGWNAFILSSNARIEMLAVGDMNWNYREVGLDDLDQLPEPIDTATLARWEADSLKLVLFDNKPPDESRFSVTYTATFDQDVDNVRFSSERVGNEVTATILERGAYFSPAAVYYPQGSEELCIFSVEVEVPEGWSAISDGNPIDGSRDNIFSFSNPYPSDGLFLFAAPFVIGTADAAGVEIACLFFEEDSSLIQEYLDACVRYMTMYTDLIGPYPYKRFSVVENFFPTGYGMPGWTLLGQQVLRLPFIKYTSLGHEVLHNWWGNSVLVDYERGNWCEGLTVYGADYRYKLMQSQDAATGYRKDILKQYVSYVDEGNDFPLREFTSRSSPETRTIGYNKAMMVFHMIHDEVGDSAFFDAWRFVYEKYKGVQISWEEWIDAFENTSGMDLSWVIPQWIDRTGSPYLSVAIVGASDDGRSVQISISDNADDEYRLSVPIRFETAAGQSDTTVLLDSKLGSYTIQANGRIQRLTVDPDHDLFRRLHPDEAEPVISASLGNDRFIFATMARTLDELEAFSGLARNLTGDTGKVSILTPPVKPERDAGLVLLGGDYERAGLDGLVSMIGSDSIVIAGTTYALEGHTFVLSTRGLHGFGDGLIVESGDVNSLPRIGQLLPHYGKYSYLVFEGARNIGKGQWPVTASPMSLTF